MGINYMLEAFILFCVKPFESFETFNEKPLKLMNKLKLLKDCKLKTYYQTISMKIQ